MNDSCYACGQKVSWEANHYRCGYCGLLRIKTYAESPLDGFMEDYGDAYKKKYEGYHLTDEGARLSLVRLGVLAQNWPPGTRVLDFGGGVGSFAKTACRNGYPCDVSDVNGLRMLPGIALVDIEDAFKGQYDVVTFFDLLEHLPDPRELLQRFEKSGVQGFVIAAPDPERSLDLSLLPSWKHFRRNEHYFGFSPHSLQDILTTRWKMVLQDNSEECIREDITTTVWTR